MLIRAEQFDFLSNLDTLTAIVAGAVLATVGGFVGAQIEYRLDTRRRERQAAVFFGEIMSLLNVSVEAAQRARGIGDPYGPVTIRILRTIRRELDIYERNRERLFDLSNPALRARIHRTLLRTTMGVEGALESAAEATDIQTEFQTSPDMTAARREHLDAKLAQRLRLRDGGFDFLVEASAQAAKLAKEIEPIARVDFERLVRATRDD